MSTQAAIRNDSLQQLSKYLRDKGYEVDTEVKGYRQIMFRKDNTAWTQGYTNNTNMFTKFSGPETNVINKYIHYKETKHLKD